MRFALLLCLSPAVAGAWQHAVSDEGIPLSWPETCVVYHLNERGSEDTTVEKMRAAVQAGFDAWTAVEGSYLTFVYGGLTSKDEAGEASRRNIVTWIEDEADWIGVDADILSITALTYDAELGRILDGDILLNGAWFEFSSEAGSSDYDIQATVMHEIGHLAGLDDSEIPGAVMHPDFERGKATRRELSEDDMQGLSALYPVTSDPAICDDSLVGDFYPSGTGGGSGGCAVGADRGAVALGLVVLLLLGLFRRRTLVALVMLLAVNAQAYELYMSPSAPVPLRWYKTHAQIWFDERTPQELDPALAEAEIARSFEEWQWLTCDGTSVPFEFEFMGRRACSVGYDDAFGATNENCVIWVPGKVAWTHGIEVLALTSLTYDTGTGEIVDADLELNDAHFIFSLDPDGEQADLANTVVHETGHFLGLDHSHETLATMYAKAPLGETIKRDLEADDIAGYCALYGPSAPPRKVTAPPTVPASPTQTNKGRSCFAQAAAAPTTGAWMGLVLVLGLLAIRRTELR